MVRGARTRQCRYARTHLRAVMDLKQCGRLIDIGSSTSPFPNYAVEAGYQVTVVDYVRPPNLNPEITFLKGTLNKEGEISSHVNEGYDVVTALAVLEHCREPRVAMRELSSLCAPDGIIYVITPEINCFADRNALGKTSWFYPPEHVHLISRGGMVLAFSEVGCELVYRRKLEINQIRWMCRYGLGVVEGAIGWSIRCCHPSYWIRAKETRVSFYQGIAAFMFRKPHHPRNESIVNTRVSETTPRQYKHFTNGGIVPSFCRPRVRRSNVIDNRV